MQRNIIFLGLIVAVFFSLLTPIAFAPVVTIDNTSLQMIRDALKPVIPNPLEMHGTEYIGGEVATPFLQLKDAGGMAIINGSCYIDIFYPNKTAMALSAPMLYIPNSDGLYFYTYNLPIDILGVYPMSAECVFTQTNKWFYTLTGWNPFGETCGAEHITATASIGTLFGDTISLNNLMDWAYVKHESSAKVTNATFVFNATASGCKINRNMTTLDFYYMGETDYAGMTITFYFWNWNVSRWQNEGALAPAGKAMSTGTSGASDYFSVSVDLNNYTASDGTAKVMIYASGGTNYNFWYDWLAFKTSGNSTVMTDLKGSSELHVSNASSFTADQLIPTIYGLLNQTHNEINQTVIPNQLVQLGLLSQINSTLNQTVVPILVSYQPYLIQINDTLNRSVYPILIDIQGNLSVVSTTVWSYPNRTITQYLINASDVWNYLSRSLTQAVGTSNLSANDVWEYFNRSLTGITATSNLTASEVWSYINRNLTQSVGTSNLSAYDVWSYLNRTMTEVLATSNLTAGEVWDYFNRTLTQPVGASNMSADDVWNHANRTLTQFSLNASDIWDYSNRTLTQIVGTSDLTAGDVWGYGSRILTSALLTASDVWGYTARTLTDVDWNVSCSVNASINATVNTTCQWAMPINQSELSVITDKQTYLPDSPLKFTVYTLYNNTYYKIFAQNGTELFASPPLNGSGTYTFAYQAPPTLGAYLIGVYGGNKSADTTFYVNKGFWDIAFEPVLLLFVAVLVFIFAVYFFRFR
jgi:hypothetical protein